jgi:hypothetical protein
MVPQRCIAEPTICGVSKDGAPANGWYRGPEVETSSLDFLVQIEERYTWLHDSIAVFFIYFDNGVHLMEVQYNSSLDDWCGASITG